MQLVILNGFDRCGSSFIGGLLARHPQINYFFQPFSGTEIHRTQFELWGKDALGGATEKFLHTLLLGNVEYGYIASDWFERFSDFDLSDPGRIGLVKETKLHTKVVWLKQRFPEVQLYGIWRDPRAILCSLVRNGFHVKWYGESAYLKTVELIASEPRLDVFAEYARECRDAVEQMALVIAVRTSAMAMELASDRWIVYEQVQQDPDKYLKRFCQGLGLSQYSFSAYMGQDYNVSGLPFRNAELWREYFSEYEIDRINRIFRKINDVASAA